MYIQLQITSNNYLLQLINSYIVLIVFSAVYESDNKTFYII